MANITKWLEEDNHRIVLIDVQYHDGVELREINFSSHPYVMRHGEVYINSLDTTVYDTIYDDIIEEIPNIVTKINSSVSIGQITLLNTDGEYDYLLDSSLAFEGHKIKVYLGDPSWFRSEFILILDGIIHNFTAPSIDKLAIEMRDRKEVLDKPIQINKLTQTYVESLLVGTPFTGTITSDRGVTGYPKVWEYANIVIPEGTTNANIPLCFGYCFNIEPVLIDSWNHVYQIHEGSIEAVTEVRSNGIILSPGTQYEVNLSIGCIRLLVHDQSTQITCDVIGNNIRSLYADTLYTLTPHSAADIIEWIILEKSELTNTEICGETFPSTGSRGFDNISNVGIYITSDDSMINVIEQVINSVGGYIRFGKTSSCNLQIIKLIDPELETPTLYLDADSIISGGLSLISIEQPNKSVNLGYQKNWGIQDKGSLAGMLLEDRLDLVDKYTTEFSNVLSYNIGLAAQFPLAEDSELIPCLIYNEVDAQVEADRRASIRSKKRYTYKIDSVASPFTINIGDVINLKHIRYGFTGRIDASNTSEAVTGRNCLVIGLEEQPIAKRVTLEVWL